jgi:hypothetical protein
MFPMHTLAMAGNPITRNARWNTGTPRNTVPVPVNRPGHGFLQALAPTGRPKNPQGRSYRVSRTTVVLNTTSSGAFALEHIKKPNGKGATYSSINLLSSQENASV